MPAEDHLSGPQFSSMEQDLLRRRSVWQDGNDHHVDRIVDRHAQPAPTLYRGISVTAERNYLDPHSLKVGDRLSLPVSSFSEDHDVAYDFAHAANNDENHHGPYTPVMLRAEGARGLNMASVSNMPWEREWLSKGQFEVVHKGSDPDNDIDHDIHLRYLPQA